MTDSEREKEKSTAARLKETRGPPEPQDDIPSGMALGDFVIGATFWCAGLAWRCTDIGTRTIAAIKLDRGENSDWYQGPPYAVTEFVFDEDDILCCSPRRISG